MRISDFSIQNPIKVAVGVILVWLFGLIALFQIPVQLTPEVSRPMLSVRTTWAGASPSEIEREIVSQQEEQLQDVEGMIDFRSECVEGTGMIDMEFEVGTDLDAALVRVNKRLAQVREYPPEADEPMIRMVSINSSSIAYFALIAQAPSHDKLRAFLEYHPELQAAVAPLLAAPKIDLPQLTHLSEQYPALQELIKHNVDPRRMKRFAEDVIAARFQRIDGVAAADVRGGRDVEARVIVDPVRLAARQITITGLRDALLADNQDVSGGDIWEGKSRYLVRTLGSFSRPEQVENVIVAHRDGAPVYVRDVARVRIDHTKPDGIGRQRGINSLSLSVQRKEGANVMEVMAGIRRETASLNANELAAQGLELIQVYDETVYIDSATRLVRDNIFVGGVLAALVLFVFLRNGRSTLVVVLAIPISAIGTFLVVRLLGRSINVISLAGMAFAIGMVVDAAIVVLENIYTHYQRGENAFVAASRGTSEVWGAVLASTLTTLAVFLPVIFIQDEAGQLFRDISIAISAGVSISLLVSLTVIPSAASQLLRRKKKTPSPDASHRGRARHVERALDGLASLGSRFVTRVVAATDTLQAGDFGPRGRRIVNALFFAGALCLVPLDYAELDSWPWYVPVPHFVGLIVALVATVLFVLIARWAVRPAIVVMMIVLALGLSYRLLPETEYLPTGNKNLVFARLQSPPGYNVDQTLRLAERVEERLRKYWEVDIDGNPIEELDGPQIDSLFVVSRGGGGMFMGARSVDPNRAAELVPVMRHASEGLPGVLSGVSQASLFERGMGTGRTVDIEITGPELSQLIALGQRVQDEVRRIFPPETETSVQPIPDLDMGSPELHVRPNSVKAAERGIQTVDLGYTINALVDGAYAGPYWHEGKEIDLVIFGSDQFLQRTQDIAQLPIATPRGELVAVADVSDVKLSTGPEQINRIDRERAVTIRVGPGPDISLEGAMLRIQQEILDPIVRTGDLAPGYNFRLAGTADNLNQMRTAMTGGMIFALVITYLLLAGLYESFLYPLVIMVSVPMAAVGGFIGLQILNLFTVQRLDTLTMLGFIILIGTVVNNAILIVDQALWLIRRDRADHRTAVRESVRGRVRPIFMATLTTLLGMLPLVLFPGAGSELYRGLGSVILGGLLVSTCVTLFLVPLLFSLTYELRTRLVGRDSATVVVAAREMADEPETVTAHGNGHRSAPTGQPTGSAT